MSAANDMVLPACLHGGMKLFTSNVKTPDQIDINSSSETFGRAHAYEICVGCRSKEASGAYSKAAESASSTAASWWAKAAEVGSQIILVTFSSKAPIKEG